MSEISSESVGYDDVVYEREPRGVRRRTPPDRVRLLREGDVELYSPLEPVWESPRCEAESVPRYESVDVTMFVPEPDANSIDSSVMSPVPVPVPVFVSMPVSPRVKDDDE